MLAELIHRINADEVGLVVAVTIRTDRYEAMQRHPAFDGIGTAIFDDLKPMPREEFKEIIVGPAARATEAGKRLVIKDNLVARLLEDVGEGADTLPLVALTLSRLYADYGGTGEISASDYEAMGGMADVVNNAIDELLNQYPGGREKALELLRPALLGEHFPHVACWGQRTITGSHLHTLSGARVSDCSATAGISMRE